LIAKFASDLLNNPRKSSTWFGCDEKKENAIAFFFSHRWMMAKGVSSGISGRERWWAERWAAGRFLKIAY